MPSKNTIINIYYSFLSPYFVIDNIYPNCCASCDFIFKHWTVKVKLKNLKKQGANT